MDDQPAQQTNQVIFPQKPNNAITRMVFICTSFLILGFVIGFIISPLINPQKKIQPVTQKPTIDESKLAVSLSLLQNPIVYEWRGSVAGKITAVDQHLFTIENDKGNKITITDKTPSGGIFRTEFLRKSGSTWKEASSSAVSVGSNLRGEFFIFKGGNNTPVGSIFFIEK